VADLCIGRLGGQIYRCQIFTNVYILVVESKYSILAGVLPNWVEIVSLASQERIIFAVWEHWLMWKDDLVTGYWSWCMLNQRQTGKSCLRSNSEVCSQIENLGLVDSKWRTIDEWISRRLSESWSSLLMATLCSDKSAKNSPPLHRTESSDLILYKLTCVFMKNKSVIIVCVSKTYHCVRM